MKKPLLILIIIFSHNQIFGQHFNSFLNKGNADFKLGLTTCLYDKVYDDDGESKTIVKTRTTESTLDVRYGLSNKVNLTFDAPFLIINTVKGSLTNYFPSNISSKYTAPGDFDLGFDLLFLNKDPWKIIVGLNQSLATGKNNQQIGLNTGYADYHQKLKIKLMYEPSTKWNFIACAGITNHNKGYSDEITGKMEVNILALKNLWFNLRIEGIQPLENGDLTKKPFADGALIANGSYYGLYSQNKGYFMISPEVHFEFKNNLGLYSSIKKILIGQNYPNGIFYELGIHYILKSNN